LESNAAAQSTAITNLTNIKATIAYVDTSIGLALSSNAVLANVAAVNANVAAANAAILLRANLSGAAFSGNISANYIAASNYVRTNTYFVGGAEANQGLGQQWASPAALFFGNTSANPSPEKYYQINLQNLDPEGSGDLVVTADDGTDGSNYVVVGINNSLYNNTNFGTQTFPHDGYLYITGGNLGVQSATHNIALIAGDGNTIPQVLLTQSNILELRNGVTIKFGDGTVQSTAFGGNANLSSLNANITAANAAITSLQANASSQALDLNSLLNNAAIQGATINALVSNAASQAIQIESINNYQVFANSNAAAQAISISNLNANITAANLNITTLLANAATQSLELDNLQANAQTQQGNIISLQSNSAAQAIQINLLNANVTAANTNIISLTSNAATQGSQINLINANVIAANLNIVTLTTNAATQALSLDNLQANINFYLSNVNSVNANVSAANLEIGKLNSNITAANSAITTLQTNAASQAVSINLLNTYSANLSDSVIFNGNVRSNYLLANANVIATNGIFESIQGTSSTNYPGLASRFIGNVDGYYQLVIQNMSSDSDASGDIVVTADTGNNAINFITMGINSSTFNQQWQDTIFIENALDGYIECVGGNIALRTLSNLNLLAGNALVVLLPNDDLYLFNTNLRFQDGSIQKTAITDVPALYANIGLIVNNLQSIDANIGTTIIDFDILDANVGAYQDYANTTIYTDSNVTSYLQSVTGNILPAANLIYTLGNVDYQWQELYVSGNITIGNVIALSNVIGNVSYTPANAANYNSTITNVQQALDELAERIKALGG
jgi:hypothetical protein